MKKVIAAIVLVLCVELVLFAVALALETNSNSSWENLLALNVVIFGTALFIALIMWAITTLDE